MLESDTHSIDRAHYHSVEFLKANKIVREVLNQMKPASRAFHFKSFLLFSLNQRST